MGGKMMKILQRCHFLMGNHFNKIRITWEINVQRSTSAVDLWQQLVSQTRWLILAPSAVRCIQIADSH